MAESKEEIPVKSIKFKEKDKNSLPAGAKIISKETSVDVEEIENGYLISKRVEIKYQMTGKDYTDWKYCNYKYYSKDNPIKLQDNKNKELADLFD